MTTYRTFIPVPSELQSYYGAIRGVAEIVAAGDEEFIVHIEAEDEYELAETVHHLRDELAGISMTTIDIPRPFKVEFVVGETGKKTKVTKEYKLPRRFSSEDEAAKFIETLPDYEKGTYYLDGPSEDPLDD